MLKGGHSSSRFFPELDKNPQGVDTVTWDINIGDVVVHDLNIIHMGDSGG
ncbi:MAG: hypothetical protein P8L31_10770 [Pseudomonadales bacterium]|nr:hypothetical protein [Pseudomonadales bacterium]